MWIFKSVIKSLLLWMVHIKNEPDYEKSDGAEDPYIHTKMATNEPNRVSALISESRAVPTTETHVKLRNKECR